MAFVMPPQRATTTNIQQSLDPGHRHTEHYNVSTVRDSEKVQLRRIGSRLRAFQRATD